MASSSWDPPADFEVTQLNAPAIAVKSRASTWRKELQQVEVFGFAKGSRPTTKPRGDIHPDALKFLDAKGPGSLDPTVKLWLHGKLLHRIKPKPPADSNSESTAVTSAAPTPSKSSAVQTTRGRQGAPRLISAPPPGRNPSPGQEIPQGSTFHGVGKIIGNYYRIGVVSEVVIGGLVYEQTTNATRSAVVLDEHSRASKGRYKIKLSKTRTNQLWTLSKGGYDTPEPPRVDGDRFTLQHGRKGVFRLSFKIRERLYTLDNFVWKTDLQCYEEQEPNGSNSISLIAGAQLGDGRTSTIRAPMQELTWPRIATPLLRRYLESDTSAVFNFGLRRNGLIYKVTLKRSAAKVRKPIELPGKKPRCALDIRDNCRFSLLGNRQVQLLWHSRLSSRWYSITGFRFREETYQELDNSKFEMLPPTFKPAE